MEDLTPEEIKAAEKARKQAEKEALKATEPEEAPFSIAEYLNERVPFIAILDDDKYKDDIVVTVNGKAYQIQRGENVMIPRFVHNAILDAERQKRSAALTQRRYEETFRAESNKQ